jgi:hypothetical protein
MVMGTCHIHGGSAFARGPRQGEAEVKSQANALMRVRVTLAALAVRCSGQPKQQGAWLG